MAQVFLVGGAVRDLLMGLEPKDFDFVVVGSSPEEMLSLGFTQVGADFPVFLHPATGDEFALARTERKMGHGYTGFDCNWEGVTLEQDLERRDLTINAMAISTGQDEHGTPMWEDELRIMANLTVHWDAKFFQEVLHNVIDPFGGQADIEDKLLCCVSEHFAEDPLRVLRLGRFLARFGEGWTVDGDTMAECLGLVQHGKLEHLTPERVWKEMERALMEKTPSKFFEFLSSIRWEGVRELTALKGVEQRPDFHPEGDAFVHTMLCLDMSARNGDNLECRFATLCHDFGKRPAFDANTARGETHLGGHEAKGVPLVKAFCERNKVPNSCRDWAVLVALDHTNVHNLHKLNPKTVVKMFKRWNLLGIPHRAEWMFSCVTADAQGRGEKFDTLPHPNGELLIGLAHEFQRKVDVEELNANRRKPVEGKALGDSIERERQARVGKCKATLLETLAVNPR